MGDLNSFQESHLLFWNKGSIVATLSFEALGQVSFSTGSAELFGLPNFGGTLTIPGLVTIGPNFKILAVRFTIIIRVPLHAPELFADLKLLYQELTGKMTLHM